MATESVDSGTGPSGPAQGADEPQLTPSTLPLRRHLRNIAADVWHPETRGRGPRDPKSPSTREVVNGLDRREAVFGLLLALLEVVVTVVGYHVSRDSSTATVRANATSFLVSGLIGAVLMLAGTALKRRALLGFASFLVGLESLTYQFRLGAVVYLFFGGWLLYRVFQKQKQDRALAPASARPSARASGTRSAGSRAGAAPSSGPRASKRYTPPKRNARRR